MLLVYLASLGLHCGVQASLVVEHRLQARRPMGSVVVVHKLSCSMVCRIFLIQGSNLYLLHW